MKIDKIVFTLLLAFILFSCGQKEAKEHMKTYGDAEKEFIAALTKEDSIKVLEQARICMDSLKSGNIESALRMLYVVKENHVLPLGGKDLKETREHFQHFPVVDYNLDYFTFSTQGCNDLKYRIKFTEKDEKGNVPAIAFMFNPVKIDNRWYLCIKGKDQSSKEILNPREKNSPAPSEIKLLQ